jgi:hypothetical protein
LRDIDERIADAVIFLNRLPTTIEHIEAAAARALGEDDKTSPLVKNEDCKRPLEEEKEMVIGEPAACRQPMSRMANTTLTLGTVWRFTSRFNLLYRNELSFFTLQLLHLLIIAGRCPAISCVCMSYSLVFATPLRHFFRRLLFIHPTTSLEHLLCKTSPRLRTFLLR